MPKMVCVKCNVEFRPEKNGIIVAEMFQKNTAIYKLWSADLWKCPVCGVEVVAGFAMDPFAEHYETDLKSIVSEAKAGGRTVIYDEEAQLC